MSGACNRWWYSPRSAALIFREQPRHRDRASVKPQPSNNPIKEDAALLNRYAGGHGIGEGERAVMVRLAATNAFY
jgi:hypothetical protein